MSPLGACFRNTNVSRGNFKSRQAVQRTLAVILAWAAPWLNADSQISIDTSAYAGLSADVLFDLINGGGPPVNAVTISNFTGAEVIFSSENQGAVTGSLPAGRQNSFPSRNHTWST